MHRYFLRFRSWWEILVVGSKPEPSRELPSRQSSAFNFPVSTSVDIVKELQELTEELGQRK